MSKRPQLMTDICDLFGKKNVGPVDGIIVLSILLVSAMKENGYTKTAALKIIAETWDHTPKT